VANIAAHQAERFGDTFVAERLSLAVEAARLGTWQWDIKTNRVLWSMELERIHGLAPGTFDGTFEAYQADIHPEDREHVLRTIDETVRARKPHVLEYRIVLPDGSIRWLEARGRMFFDALGDPDRLVGVCMDITDRKRAEEALRRSEQNLRERAEELARVAHALERSNRELDAFAYAASHDLRAPLRGIANLAQWIEEDLQTQGKLPDETQEMLQLMRSRMHRMEALIEGLLEYSRAGRVHQEPERVDTGRLVRDIIDLLAPAETVTVSVAPDLPTLTTARLPLQQVLLNLIGNALKHANREHAEVVISAADAGPSIEFSVRDNGQGIPREFQDRIWGIFQTLEARDKIEGTGIGLALVRKLVDAEGGRVWVESEPGQGANFKFLWPKTPKMSGAVR
jgi:PAS domain S-box-containing protein